jgi:hypothetical protein
MALSMGLRPAWGCGWVVAIVHGKILGNDAERLETLGWVIVCKHSAVLTLVCAACTASVWLNLGFHKGTGVAAGSIATAGYMSRGILQMVPA